MPVSADKENKLGVHPNDHKSTATLDGGVGGRRAVPLLYVGKKYLFKIWFKLESYFFISSSFCWKDRFIITWYVPTELEFSHQMNVKSIICSYQRRKGFCWQAGVWQTKM